MRADVDRIEALEAEVRRLRERVATLEAHWTALAEDVAAADAYERPGGMRAGRPLLCGAAPSVRAELRRRVRAASEGEAGR